MALHYISQKEYLQAAQWFHWASKEHYQLWFTGRTGRHRRTEVMLHRLVKKGKLRTTRAGRKLLYAAPRKGYDLGKVDHGLACTEALVRFWRSKMDCKIIPEKAFRGFGIVPEWGLLYPSSQLLLFEFCTMNNSKRPGLVKSKITRYEHHLPEISNWFGGEGFVVFVMDIPKIEVEKFVTGDNLFFTDYETFKQVPLGSQLAAPIYIWGADKERYPLAK